AWLAGLAAGAGAAGAGIALSRVAIRRDRRRVDPESRERLAELPPEDLGPLVSFDGSLLTVRAAGDPSRPAVVFSHGFSLDMTTWHYQWKELSKRYRCVLFDHRGHGGSGAAEGSDYSLQAMGEDLVAVLDAAVGEGPVVLVGHSMGGMAILAMAERHPEEFGPGGRIAGVVFADTAAAEVVRGALAGVTARIHALVSAPKRAERIHRFMRAGESDLAYAVSRLTQFGPKAPPSLVAHVARISGRAPLEVWGDGLAGILRMDFRHAVEHVRVPSLVMVGDVDRITPPASALALKDALPDARLVVLKGAGHLAMMERHEQFNRVTERFLESVLAQAATPAARGRRP
ncbi:MAG: alpha/beta hydrolase, partial [Actinomycetota bacterium]|nr:alpha/beta hydrolase [Actinomycetota bacterium]